MSQSVSPQLIHLSTHGQGTAICPHCGAGSRISATSYHNLHTSLVVTCPCSQSFSILFNTRKFYRKVVALPGTYTLPGEETLRQMTVENLSLAGVHLRPLLPNTLHIGDIVTLVFCLRNDPQYTELCQRAIVRWINRRVIGAEFCDLQASEQALGSYLRPGS